MVNITRPEVFIDSQTGIALSTDHASQFVLLEQQFTESELQKIKEQKERAKNISIFVTICQPFALFGAGKVDGLVIVLVYVL